MNDEIRRIKREEFDASQRVRQLRRAVFEHGDADKMAALVEAERELQTLVNDRAEAESKAGAGMVFSMTQKSNLLGLNTTKIDVKVELKMSCVFSALVHLFDSEEHPLVEVGITNANNDTKRLRIITYVEGYSAQTVDTVEVKYNVPVALKHLPTFFPDRLTAITELTRATVNVEVQDLDARTEIHKTAPFWLLARTTAPLKVLNPADGTWLDMTKYLGAFVTPNAPAIMEYIWKAADRHASKRLAGYQVDEAEVLSQVNAVYDALAASEVRYVNSIIDFTPESTSANQRVRLPRESLANKSANCIDGTVLMASLLEAISLNPAIVIIPGHAFLGWETWRNNGQWRYVETTMLSTADFKAACAKGDSTAKEWQEATGSDESMFKRMPLGELRAHGVMPLE